MNNLTDWIKYELYPVLFERIPEAFPEFNFKLKGKNWKSTNRLKITGEEGDSTGKVYVWENNPGYIKDFTRGHKGLVDYVMGRDNVAFIEAVKILAEIAGLPLPKNPDYNEEAYKRSQEKANLLEEANSYFIYSLENDPKAKPVREYLSSRQNKGYSQDTINLTKAIGSTHRLTIPYRSGGIIKGFNFRAIGDNTTKYLNSTNLDKAGGFFNISGIKGDKDLVIVEGELDALHASALGLENVVATGGSFVSDEQIKDALRRGAKKFTICYDTEPGKEAEMARKVNSAIRVISVNTVNKVYIANIPALGGIKTDPDSYIKDQGIEAFKNVISKAIPFYSYRLREILRPYKLIHDERPLTAKERDDLLDEISETTGEIREPIDRDHFINEFLYDTDLKGLNIDTDLKGLNISKESLEETAERLAFNKDKERQAQALRDLMTETRAHQDKGETDTALEKLKEGIKDIEVIDSQRYISNLLKTPSLDDIRGHFGQEAESLKSGYTIKGEEVLFPSGALTGIAGATNHGKTDLLINLTLNAVKNYPDKEFYFFTYEMSQENILVRFLNSFLDMNLQQGSNQRAIKDYFRTGETQYTKAEQRGLFIEKTDLFFKEFIRSGRLRVKGIDFTSPELCMAMRGLKKRGDVGAYFIDYFQLLRLPKEGYKNYSRQEELKVICQDLNITAKDLQLPVILGAQFNREVTTPFRLHATNIGEAGDIERILDTLLGIWYTNKTALSKDMSKAENALFSERGLDEKDRLYIEVLKSRETATGDWDLLDYNGKRGLISNRPTSYF